MTEQTYRIKPLGKWKRFGGVHTLKTLLGTFEVFSDFDGWEWNFFGAVNGDCTKTFETLDAAKSAAEAKYRDLLLTALEPTPKETN